MRRLLAFLSIPVLVFAACDVLQEASKTIGTGPALTEQEVISGLKEALQIGTEKSVNVLSAVNGFYGSQRFRIPLPPEADIVVQHKDHPLLKAAGITNLIKESEERLNRAAEDAVKSATPIFTNAIKTMSIQDAFGILNGNDTAATHFFRNKTYSQLKKSFQPKIKSSLDKPLVGSLSANEGWKSMADAYNGVAGITGWKKVNTQLDDYTTRKALNALFIQLGEEEKKIRRDPQARVTEILRRVFGR